MDNHLRSEIYKRSQLLEELLERVNDLLSDVETKQISELSEPSLPTVMIVGNPRSGTTMLYQILAASGLFAYPSNIMSRFYKAPLIGGMIHKIFIDYDKNGEVCGDCKIDFESNLGKTKGAGSPHEFWYFWNRFFKFGKIQRLNEEELGNVDHILFLKELAAIENCFSKPLLLKALNMNWNIEYLDKILKKPLFLYIKRDVIRNMASLYKARKLFYDDPSKWYSFKIPEYEELRKNDIYIQLAGQVLLTNRYIENSLKKLDPKTYIILSCERLCDDPEGQYNLVISQLKKNGYHADIAYTGEKNFKPNSSIIAGFDEKEAVRAVKFIESMKSTK